MFRRIAIAMVLGCGLCFGLAAPALASPACTGGSACQTVNVSVSTIISISGLTNVTFANAVPNQSDNLTPAEVYTVQSNDPLGYVLSEAAGNAVFQSDSTSATIPDTDWTISGTITGSDPGTEASFSPGTTAEQIVNTGSGPASDTFTENWSLFVPASLAAGTYTNTLTYLAVGH